MTPVMTKASLFFFRYTLSTSGGALRVEHARAARVHEGSADCERGRAEGNIGGSHPQGGSIARPEGAVQTAAC